MAAHLQTAPRMLLFTLLTVLNAAPSSVHLLDEATRAELQALDRREQALQRSPDVLALRVMGGVVLGIGAALPVVLGVVPLVLSFFIGVSALVSATSAGPALAAVWGFFFNWVPAPIWVAVIATCVVGGALLGGSFVADSARRAALKDVRAERKALLHRAPIEQAPVPLTTLLRF